MMQPGDMIDLDIPVAPLDRAVLVRYTVQPVHATGIDEDRGEMPAQRTPDIYLAPCHPSPSLGHTEIIFRLPDAKDVELSIVDAGGRLVAVLHNGRLDAGEHRVVWNGIAQDGLQAESGVYFSLLKAGKNVVTRRLVLLR